MCSPIPAGVDVLGADFFVGLFCGGNAYSRCAEELE